ncbi:BamA/TamA family outer membrane protein [Veillonella nakazawae]|uniref:BamA/OMP85 family outer membrane protein n=1 Tax=Veillonella sp. TaxID=1926307 RepID=UPI00255456DD|nr:MULTISPECIES: BamA/TamA family outer membrane protein [Veillonella]MDK7739879.1 BamA/TamA family outer membrane protein [Veillonella nakazawae]MDU1410219.1 BamA/TamA family outer membrane protein [Veillonella sp.]MDU2165560.1 BamA/TamA family outer membrane protein [Veillonella sp.]MDU2903317.1 BamA/TamA family outer membrane protein [Veillonella sp.]MDU2964719.1 BamA/TamA family outer membrane protein [Veillonella sp.]
MFKPKAYKSMLAASVLTAVMGTGSVFAAKVQVGYTPDLNNTTTTNAATTNDATTTQAVYNADAATPATTQDETDAAILAARGDTTISSDGTVVKGSDGTVTVNNAALKTDDKQVKMVSKTTGGTDLDKAAENGQTQAVTTVEAQYVTAANAESINPYVGKLITGLSISGVTAEQQAQLLPILSEKIGDAVSVDGVFKDVTNLGNTGYFSEVNPVFTSVPEGVKLDFAVTVNPITTGVSFEGNTVYTSEVLTKFMDLQPGQVLNSVYVGQKVQGINAAYARDGYMLAHVDGIRVDDQGVLHVHIVEGIVEDIIPAGNKKTRDKVITREFVQKKGKPFNKFLVRRSVERVYNLGFFDDVNVRMLPGDQDPNNVIIEIDVLEHKTGTITLGAGYSESDGLMGIIEFGEDNFRGTGDKFKVHWEIGGKKKYKNYQISYLKPWIDSKGTSLGFSFFNREDEYTDYNEDGNEVAEYNKKSRGFNISFGRQTGEYTRDYLTLESRKDTYKWDSDDSSGYRYDTDAISNTTGSGNDWNNTNPSTGGSWNFASNNYVKNNFGRINSITWQKVYDSRDNIYDPTRGRRISYTAQWAGHGLGGDFDFYKFTAEARMYKKLGAKNVLAFRARGGFIQGDAPYSQLFTLGGADSLRGYEDDQFRGKYMYNATLEFRFPIVKKVSGVLFTDIGDAWDAPNVTWYNSKKTFNYGVGAGVRITTPIGPVKLDYGVGKHKNKFHFSFGTQF